MNSHNINMKKQILLWVALLFEVCLLPAQTSITPSGSGTNSDPYQIATLNNLYWLSQTSSAWSGSCIQTTDIDATTTSVWNSGSGFLPIGNNSKPFAGYYHGKGHTITGLTINRTSSNYIGLFGWTSGATIDSLGLASITISGNRFVGAIVGNNSSSTLSDCYSTGSVTGFESEIGGLVGYNYSSSHVKNCYSTGNVSGVHELGVW